MVKRLKILLTGSTGYLGRNILNFFNDRNIEITEFSRDDIDLLFRRVDVKQKIDFFEYHPKLKNKYDVIIHTAAIPYSECEKDPQNANLVNYLLPEFLSRYCTMNNCFFIFFSSVQVYGEKLSGYYDEKSIITPVTNYSISKANAEKYLIKMIAKNNLKGTILRIGNVVGILNNVLSKGWGLFANSSLKNAVLKKEISITNNPNLRRNFVPIDLLMAVLEKILDDYSKSYELIPKILNITTGESKTLLEYSILVSQEYKNIFNQSIQIKFEDKLLSPIPYSVIENKKLKNYFCSFEKYSLEKTIKKTLEIIKSI